MAVTPSNSEDVKLLCNTKSVSSIAAFQTCEPAALATKCKRNKNIKMHLENSALKLSNLQPDAVKRGGDTMLHGEHMIVASPPCVPWNRKLKTHQL
jgi:hypothetical protein